MRSAATSVSWVSDGEKYVTEKREHARYVISEPAIRNCKTNLGYTTIPTLMRSSQDLVFSATFLGNVGNVERPLIFRDFSVLPHSVLAWIYHDTKQPEPKHRVVLQNYSIKHWRPSHRTQTNSRLYAFNVRSRGATLADSMLKQNWRQQ